MKRIIAIVTRNLPHFPIPRSEEEREYVHLIKDNRFERHEFLASQYTTDKHLERLEEAMESFDHVEKVLVGGLNSL